mmetsp:Transcript_17800/g.23205  ORF Transcript_17800/g.23205 Transcript_17800/m.23205 type:complete len:88 (-) Transcript_17800:281-544(-)
MSAIFDFSSLITVILLFICTCTYMRGMRATIFDDIAREDEDLDPRAVLRRRSGLRSICWKAARIGERISPYISIALVCMAAHLLFLK